MRMRELTEWAVATGADGCPLVVLVVDPADDPELAGALGAGTGTDGGSDPQPLAGTWRAGELTGLPVVSFLLVEEADPGLERAWWTSAFDRALLEAVLAEPHTVALVPAAAAGDRAAATLVAAAARGGLAVEVTDASRRIAELLSALPG